MFPCTAPPPSSFHCQRPFQYLLIVQPSWRNERYTPPTDWRTRIRGTPWRSDRHGWHASQVLRNALTVMADTHHRYSVTPWPSWRTRTRGTPWRPDRHGWHASEVHRDALTVMTDTYHRYSVTPWPSWRTRIRFRSTPWRLGRHGGQASEVHRDALTVMADTHQRYSVTPWPSWRLVSLLSVDASPNDVLYTELLSRSWICHLWLSYCVARTDFLVFLPLIHKLNVRTVGYMKRSEMGSASVFTPKHSRLFVSKWDW